jgi:transcriptional regulator with XRE-family HTH domain
MPIYCGAKQMQTPTPLTPPRKQASVAGQVPTTLAERLRQTRLARNLSLAEVAEATDISTSFLSLVERGRSDITIGRLVRLVHFYGVSIVDLIPPEGTKDPELVRIDDRRLLHSPAEGIDVFLLGPDTERTMMPMLLEFEPGAHLAEYGRHEGEEWVYVLEGRLSLEFEDSEATQLESGDGAYYVSRRPHLFRNADAKRRLRLICVDTPPVL